MGLCCIVDAPLEPGVLIAAARRPEAGALAVFIGTIRDHDHGSAVQQIDYSAYTPMANRVLAEIAAEVAVRWPGTEIHCHHRVGRLQVGDDAVVIVASSAHRAEAFAACRHMIERIKEDCPIWKKQWGDDGASWSAPRP
jgi:molybdopterin synthase catalytic subunit